MNNKMFKLCLRFTIKILDNFCQDLVATYFFAKDNHDAVLVAQKLLKEDDELATFYEEDFEGVNSFITDKQWTVLAVNPYEGWSSQEYLVFGLDYKTFELINNCETDPDDCDYDPSCDGISPESYMDGFWDKKELTDVEKFLKYWGDLGNSLYCHNDQEKKAFCICVFIDGAGLLEGFGENTEKALEDWMNKHSGWVDLEELNK